MCGQLGWYVLGHRAQLGRPGLAAAARFHYCSTSVVAVLLLLHAGAGAYYGGLPHSLLMLCNIEEKVGFNYQLFCY